MSAPAELSDLVAYLVRTSRLTLPEAVRLIDEVLSFLDERPEEFICRRHREYRQKACRTRKSICGFGANWRACGFVRRTTPSGRSGG
jgi:hypothetical protein